MTPSRFPVNSSAVIRIFMAVCLFAAAFTISAAVQPVSQESGVYGSVKAQTDGGTYDAPVSGAVVTALDGQGKVVASAVATAEGEYRMSLAPGMYRLRAEHPAYASFDTKEVILQVQEDHFTLFNIGLSRAVSSQTGEIRGNVSSDSGNPLEGVTITVNNEVGTELSRVETGSEGEFVISLPAGSYMLTAEHPDYEMVGPLNIVVGETEPVELTLTMKGELYLQGGIQGLIRARANGGSPGRPIPGAVITATSAEGNNKVTATSNGIGFYKLTLQADSYRLDVSHPEFESVDTGSELFTVEADTTKTWNALMPPVTPQSDVRTCRQRFPVTIGSSYGERHSVFLRIDKPGLLTISYRWTGDASSLALIVKDPGGAPRRVDGRSPLSITTEVGSDMIALGVQWEISIANFGGGTAQGTLNVSYPCEN